MSSADVEPTSSRILTVLPRHIRSLLLLAAGAFALFYVQQVRELMALREQVARLTSANERINAADRECWEENARLRHELLDFQYPTASPKPFDPDAFLAIPDADFRK